MTVPRRTLLTGSLGVAALAACGRTESPTAGPGAAGSAVASGPASGELTMWAMGAEGDKLGDFVKDFTTSNPGLKVTVTSLPWSSAHDKFVNAISAKQTPDLAMVGTTWMGEMVGLGALEPIPAGVDGSVFFPGAFETTRVPSIPMARSMPACASIAYKVRPSPVVLSYRGVWASLHVLPKSAERKTRPMSPVMQRFR